MGLIGPLPFSITCPRLVVKNVDGVICERKVRAVAFHAVAYRQDA